VAARLDQPARKIIYNDLDESAPGRASARLGRHPGLAVLHEDGTRMPSVQPASVSAIVTDPPWGEYDESIRDYQAFAQSAAAEFARVLHPRWGRLVVLVSRWHEKEMRAALTGQGFTCDPPIEILVNGHPASVLRAHLGSDRLG
jgi:Putative RNA methylase family UPF0020